MSTSCVKEWQQLCTSNATGHWSQYQFITNPLRLSPYQPSSNWSYKTYKLLSSYLLKGESQPLCEACHSPLTVKHILVDCTRYSAARQRYFGVDTPKDVFLKMFHLATSSLMLKISAFTCLLYTSPSPRD